MICCRTKASVGRGLFHLYFRQLAGPGDRVEELPAVRVLQRHRQVALRQEHLPGRPEPVRDRHRRDAPSHERSGRAADMSSPVSMGSAQAASCRPSGWLVPRRHVRAVAVRAGSGRSCKPCALQPERTEIQATERRTSRNWTMLGCTSVLWLSTSRSTLTSICA